MVKWFDKHFSMNRKELQGVSLMTALVIVLWFLPDLYKMVAPPKEYAEFEGRKKEIEAFLASSTTRSQFSEKKSPPIYPKRDSTIYSERNTEKNTSRVRPSDASNRKEWTTKKPVESIFIELNKTDSIELQQLRGIGPVFASRIVRFRDLLGGFYDKSQLLQVYGMDEERYLAIKDFVHADKALVQKININTADYQSLVKHPFVSPKQANVIVQYRIQHGNYTDTGDLLKIATLDEEFLRKIAPYLTVSDD